MESEELTKYALFFGRISLLGKITCSFKRVNCPLSSYLCLCARVLFEDKERSAQTPRTLIERHNTIQRIPWNRDPDCHYSWSAPPMDAKSCRDQHYLSTFITSMPNAIQPSSSCANSIRQVYLQWCKDTK